MHLLWMLFMRSSTARALHFQGSARTPTSLPCCTSSSSSRPPLLRPPPKCVGRDHTTLLTSISLQASNCERNSCAREEEGNAGRAKSGGRVFSLAQQAYTHTHTRTHTHIHTHARAHTHTHTHTCAHTHTHAPASWHPARPRPARGRPRPRPTARPTARAGACQPGAPAPGAPAPHAAAAARAPRRGCGGVGRACTGVCFVLGCFARAPAPPGAAHWL